MYELPHQRDAVSLVPSGAGHQLVHVYRPFVGGHLLQVMLHDLDGPVGVLDLHYRREAYTGGRFRKPYEGLQLPCRYGHGRTDLLSQLPYGQILVDYHLPGIVRQHRRVSLGVSNELAHELPVVYRPQNPGLLHDALIIDAFDGLRVWHVPKFAAHVPFQDVLGDLQVLGRVGLVRQSEYQIETG